MHACMCAYCNRHNQFYQSQMTSTVRYRFGFPDESTPEDEEEEGEELEEEEQQEEVKQEEEKGEEEEGEDEEEKEEEEEEEEEKEQCATTSRETSTRSTSNYNSNYCQATFHNNSDISDISTKDAAAAAATDPYEAYRSVFYSDCDVNDNSS